MAKWENAFDEKKASKFENEGQKDLQDVKSCTQRRIAYDLLSSRKTVQAERKKQKITLAEITSELKLLVDIMLFYVVVILQ